MFSWLDPELDPFYVSRRRLPCPVTIIVVQRIVVENMVNLYAGCLDTSVCCAEWNEFP